MEQLDCTAHDRMDRTMHVRQTRQFMDTGLGLDRLLELTHGLVEPGSAALELVLPVIAKRRRMNWALVAGLALPAGRVVEIGEWLVRALGRIEPWSAAGIEQALETGESAFEVSGGNLRSLASALAFGELTPLPLARVLEVIGKDNGVMRMRMAVGTFKAMQMVG